MTETDTNEQRLDTRFEMYRTAEYSGKIQRNIYEAAHQNGTEKDVS